MVKVERSAMDGTDRRTLFQKKGPPVAWHLVGITLDYQEDKVYWVNRFDDGIWKMDLDGGKNNCNKLLAELSCDTVYYAVQGGSNF